MVFAPRASFLVAELARVPLEKLPDGNVARAVLGALQAQRLNALNFEAVRTLVAELFSESHRANALAIAQYLWTCGILSSTIQRCDRSRSARLWLRSFQQSKLNHL